MVSKGFPVDFLYQLKQKNDIVEIISRYVKLDKKGSRYWGCCPFHNEKTPSFAVMQDDGVFHCYGCKEHGDVISFIQKIESCDFMDAVKILADNAHLEMPRLEGGEESHKKAEKKERILKLLDTAYKHYQENLYLTTAKPAQDYIKLRAFTKRELDDFKLGYSIDFKEMVDYLRRQGFTYEEMVEAGTIKKGEHGYYDVLAGRLVFPIFNFFGECVGFSARVLGQADFAKYINSAETVVFQKGKLVYGAQLLKSLKQAGKLDKIIIVEGQIDVIAMHRAGFKNTVACLGSALTSDHANILKKLSRNIVLCFDGDGAGQKATMHALDVLDAEEFNIKIVALPSGNDPDEVLKSKGASHLAELIESAVPIMDYIIEVEKSKFDLTNAQEKGNFTKAVLGELKKRLSPSAQEPYLEKLRDLTSIPIDVLRRDLSLGGQAPQTPKKEEEKVLIVRENGNIKAIKFVLACLIHHKDFVDKRINYFKLLPQHHDLLERAEEGTHISSYYDLYDVDDMPILKDCLVFNFDEFSPPEQFFKDSLWLLAEKVLRDKQSALNEQIKTCENLDERKTLMVELMKVTNQIRQKSLEEFYGN